MRTPWGYDVESLSPIVNVAQFNVMTDGAYATNPRVGAALAAASAAIRNYCGWHICPSTECTAHPNGGKAIIHLPASYVSDVESVVVGDVEMVEGTDFEWRDDGLVRRCRPYVWPDPWDGIEVQYTAGYDVDAVPDLAEAVRTITEGVLAVSAGVSSESADGVTIAYRDNAASIAQALTGAQRSALAPYKVVTAHAT